MSGVSIRGRAPKQNQHWVTNSALANLNLLVLLLLLFGCADPGQKKFQQAQEKKQSGQTEEAIGLFKEAINESPDNLVAQLELAELFMKQQRFKEALSVLERFSKRMSRTIFLNFF
jgi:thioredoxin-like negative regulator of GroEL